MMAPFMLSSYTKYVTTHREEENLYASRDKQELTDSARWWWAKRQSHGKYVSIMCTETRLTLKWFTPRRTATPFWSTKGQTRRKWYYWVIHASEIRKRSWNDDTKKRLEVGNDDRHFQFLTHKNLNLTEKRT